MICPRCGEDKGFRITFNEQLTIYYEYRDGAWSKKRLPHGGSTSGPTCLACGSVLPEPEYWHVKDSWQEHFLPDRTNV